MVDFSGGFGTDDGLMPTLGSDTILSRFRETTELNTAEYADASVTFKAEPWALEFFNQVMDETLTITSHTTGESAGDEIMSLLVASYAYKAKFPNKRFDNLDIAVWEYYFQRALELMMWRNPSKIEYVKFQDKFIPAGKSAMGPYSKLGVQNNITNAVNGLD